MPPIDGGYVHASDISNYQPGWQTAAGMAGQLGIVSPKPSHVITRLSHESVAMQVIAKNQLRATVDLGLWPGGYGWSYGDESPDWVVKFWTDLYTAVVGQKPPVLWMDMEGEHRIPNLDWADQAFNVAHAIGVQPGIYSGYYWLKDHFGLSTQHFAGEPLWMASYGVGYFQVQGWGGMRLVAHQFTSTPYDRSVFLPEVWA